MLMPQGDNSICRISKTCRHSGPRCLATGPTIEPWRDLFPSSCADCQIVVVMLGNWQTSECKSWLLAVLLAVAVTPHGHPHTHTRADHIALNWVFGYSKVAQSDESWRRHPSILFLFLFFQSRHLSPHRGVVLRCTFVFVALACLHSWPDSDGTGLQSGAQTWQQPTASSFLFFPTHCAMSSRCVFPLSLKLELFNSFAIDWATTWAALRVTCGH